MPDEREIALYNIDGEFYAVENWCPHKGAPLSEGILCDLVIECDWHGWQFDLRSGECLNRAGAAANVRRNVGRWISEDRHLVPEEDLPLRTNVFIDTTGVVTTTSAQVLNGK